MASDHKKFMEIAVQEAIKGVENDMKPFGAVVVKNGEVITTGYNTVLSTKDITDHAEIVAIRNACSKLGTWNLSGCEIYASCHPCPMCLAACLWAKINHIYYAAELDEAAEQGFPSGHIYDFWKEMKSEETELKQIIYDGYLRPFEYWKDIGMVEKNPFK